MKQLIPNRHIYLLKPVHQLLQVLVVYRYLFTIEINCPVVREPNNSAGLGGIGPYDNTCKCSISVSLIAASSC
ncbi:hypothetical protein ACQKCU_03745 [Heyndrickxia sporothermodurans]